MRKIAQELLCSFLGSGDNFIAEEYLKRIQEDEVRVPLRQEYIDLNMWIFEDPIVGEDYIMAKRWLVRMGIPKAITSGVVFSRIVALLKTRLMTIVIQC